MVDQSHEQDLDDQLVSAVVTLPPARESNIRRKEGFVYSLGEVLLVKGMKFGLGIKHYRNQVIVSKVDPGSMASEVLRVLDQICDVNGSPVTDKDVCKTLIVNSLKDSHTVSLLIARPVTKQTKDEMENALTASEMPPPSLAVAPDVRSIMRRFNNQLAQPAIEKPGILVQQPVAPRGNVRFNEEKSHKSLMIAADTTDTNALKKVPAKQPLPGSAEETKDQEVSVQPQEAEHEPQSNPNRGNKSSASEPARSPSKENLSKNSNSKQKKSKK